MGICRGDLRGRIKVAYRMGPEGTGFGRAHWGYARVILQGVYAGGGVSEEVRRRRKEEGRRKVGLSFEI